MQYLLIPHTGKEVRCIKYDILGTIIRHKLHFLRYDTRILGICRLKTNIRKYEKENSRLMSCLKPIEKYSNSF